jgi:hypothetical protein
MQRLRATIANCEKDRGRAGGSKDLNFIIRVALTLGVFGVILLAFVAMPPPGPAGLTTTTSTSFTTATYAIVQTTTIRTCFLWFLFCGPSTQTTTTTTSQVITNLNPVVSIVGPTSSELIAYVVVAKGSASLLLIGFHVIKKKNRFVSQVFNPITDGLLFMAASLYFFYVSDVFLALTLSLIGVAMVVIERQGRRKRD